MAVVYDSYADVVDESYDPARDGWDAEDPRKRTTFVLRLTIPLHIDRLRARPMLPSAVVVPYVQVGEGDKNRDAVYAIKRAYARSVSGYRLRELMSKPLDVRRTWGRQFSNEFGQRNYTKARHQLLAPYFDAFALALLRSDSEPEMSARDKQIALQLGWHNAFYNRRMSIFYSQNRPSQLRPAEWITQADCSGSVAGGCWWAKILPAVDWRYTNTWVQVRFGSLIDRAANARPGDVFFYGSPSHEALYLGNGLVWSFGSYPAKILRHDYRGDFHSIRRYVPL